MEYKVKSNFLKKGLSRFDLGEESIQVDVSKDRDLSMPGPAELLLTAFSSCILKNIERMSELLKFQYKYVHVESSALRQDSPPKFIEINYQIFLNTEESDHRIELLHKNIKQFGTVYNSISEQTKISGEIIRVDTEVI